MGIIDADPQFAGDGDFHLTQFSPCIDAGTDSEIYEDIEGDERPLQNGFDMGADEYKSSLTVFLEGYPDDIIIGELLEFTAGVTNNSSETGYFDEARIEVSGEVSTTKTLYHGPVIPLETGAETTSEVSLFVSGSAPAGTYTVTVTIYLEGRATSSNYFMIDVVEAAE